MSNVVSMDRSRDYFISRAVKHRLAGRYDEAMALLMKAKDQFDPCEELEMELARVYDAMECEQEAARSYHRVVRCNGKHRAQALFQLALSSAQNADLQRALSYFDAFEMSDRAGVDENIAALLRHQLREALETPAPDSRRMRSRALERRAVERLQQGNVYAARRTLLHAIKLKKTAQRLTLLACCHLLLDEHELAVQTADEAHEMAPWRVQTLCVLTDALYAAGQVKQARRMLYVSVLRARMPDELLSVAMESAKHGEDGLTLRLTQALLRREPFSTRGMMLRGCALFNIGRVKEASRVFGRLCGLLPEDTIAQAYFRMARDAQMPQERLSLGLTVPRQEAVERTMQLIAALYQDAEELRADADLQRMLCRLAAWAFSSNQAGSHAAVVGLIVISALKTDAAREVLLDALVDPQVSDGFKCAILQALTAQEGFIKPYDVDMGGKLVRLAAGGVSRRIAGSERCQRVVQQASDVLAPDYPDAPRVLLPLYIRYLETYGAPGEREQAACACALEAAYHRLKGRKVSVAVIARRDGVSPRLCTVMLRRLLRGSDMQKQEKEQT